MVCATAVCSIAALSFEVAAATDRCARPSLAQVGALTCTRTPPRPLGRRSPFQCQSLLRWKLRHPKFILISLAGMHQVRTLAAGVRPVQRIHLLTAMTHTDEAVRQTLNRAFGSVNLHDGGHGMFSGPS